MKNRTRTEETQTTTPTAAADIQFGLDQGRNLFNLLMNQPTPDFTTVAPFTDNTNTAFGLIADRALDGSPITDAAGGALTDIASQGSLGSAQGFVENLAGGGNVNPAIGFLEPTASGAFLDPQQNPAFQLGVDAINDSVGSIFQRAGRTGSGAEASSIARGVGDFTASLVNQERARQLEAASAIGALTGQDNAQALSAGGLLGSDARAKLGAAQLAPALSSIDFQNLQALADVGALQQQQNQREIDDSIFRFNAPFDNATRANQFLSANISGLAPLLGGTTQGTSETTQSGGLLNSILGGALTAASLFGSDGAFPLGGGGGALFRGVPDTGGNLITLPTPSGFTAPQGGAFNVTFPSFTGGG